MANTAKLSASAGEMSVIRDGKLIKLNIGDTLYEYDVVMGNGVITLADGTQIPVAGQFVLSPEIFGTASANDSAIQSQTPDVIVDALNRGEDLNKTLDATAAGFGGGDGGGGGSFVQLLRIAESVTSNQYRYGFDPLGILPITEGISDQTQQTTQTAQLTTTEVPETPSEPETPVPPSDPEEPDTPDEPQDPEQPEDPEDPEEPEDPEDPVDDGKDNNGHGNNDDGQDDDNPGQGGGGPNGDPKDGDDEDEKDKTPEVGEKDHPKEEDEEGSEENGNPKDPTEEHEDGEHDPDSEGEPEVDKDEKHHEDNGKGNGVDDAPGNSGDTKGDDADGSNTSGTDDTLDPKDVLDDPEEVIIPKGNNGFGNGDQSAPGNSGPHNGAENDLTPNLHQPSIEDLLKNTRNPHYD